jgi:signal transduction histidine kinase/CheY-like chemotaxis protein
VGARRPCRSCPATSTRPGARYLLGLIEDVTEHKRVEAALAEREAELRQAQKMEAVGRLAGGIAHDFNNLLAAISSYAELLLEDLPEPPPAAGPADVAVSADALAGAREDAREIRRAAERGATLTRQLLAFGRRQQMQPRPIDLHAVVADIGRMLGRVFSASVELRLQLAEGAACVVADPGQLEQVLLNLSMNARDAMPDGGVLTIGTVHAVRPGAARGRAGGAARGARRRRRTASPFGLAPGRYVCVTVDDTGVGMDEATQAARVRAVLHTKPPAAAPGSGLSMVYASRAERRLITVQSTPGAARASRSTARGGRRASSRTARRDAGEQAPPVEERGVAGRRRDPARRRRGGSSARQPPACSRGAPTRCSRQATGSEALGFAERHAGPIHLLVTDVRMPGMDGRELARRFRHARPEARVLLMSGYEDPVEAAPPVDGADDIGAVLYKPFTLDAFTARVRQVLAAAAPR